MGYFANIKHTRKIITSTDENIESLEDRMRIVRGERLGLKASLLHEYMTILGMFAHDVDFKDDMYQDFNLLIMQVGAMINEVDELDEIDIVVLRKLIVFLSLNVGAPVAYLTTFEDMRKSGELRLSYNKLKDLGIVKPKQLIHTFRVLTIKLGDYPSLLKDIIFSRRDHSLENLNVNKDLKDENLNLVLEYEDLTKYFEIVSNLKIKNFKDNKKRQFTKYSNIDKLLDELIDKYLSGDFEFTEDNGLFVRMLITYLEIIMLQDITYQDVYDYMVDKEYINELMDYETLIKSNSFNLKYFEKKFKGFGKSKRK